jgi:hypothetical protein
VDRWPASYARSTAPFSCTRATFRHSHGASESLGLPANRRSRPPEWTKEIEERFQKQQEEFDKRFREQQQQAAERHLQLLESIKQLAPKKVPRWKRALTSVAALAVTTVSAWAMSYYVPAPPAAATPIVNPSGTPTSQPSPSIS